MRGKYNLITHQTLSLAATSHLVSEYLLHLLARIRGMGTTLAKRERKYFFSPFRIPRELLTSSRHFLRSSNARSRERSEREYRGQALKVLPLTFD